MLTFDTCSGHRNNIRRLSSVPCTVKQTWIIVWYKQPGDEYPKHVEQANAIKDSADSLGDVAPGALGLRCSDGHKLHSLERESCVDED